MQCALSIAISGFVLTIAMLTGAEGKKQPGYLIYVGTYTGPSSKGIYAYRFDAKTGKAEELGLAAETANPSFLTLDPSRSFLYAVNEISNFHGQHTGAISSFRIDPKTGKLTLLNQASSAGAGPCFIALDRTGKHLLAANYEAGSVAVFPILPDGRLGAATSSIQHSGHGADPERQEGPHPHWIGLSANNKFAVTTDLGLDRLFVYRFDPSTGSLGETGATSFSLSPRSGPRHFTFDSTGKFGYLINEMGSTITVFSFDQESGALHEAQTISTLPKDFEGKNDTAEIAIHPNGKFLYGSNRGHDSIAVFAVDQKSGNLTNIERVPSGGVKPRTFEIDPSGSYLFVANQTSNNVVIFRIDRNTGHLTPTGDALDVPSPVCVKFLALQ
jgi:6-phosphogluconolactonase